MFSNPTAITFVGYLLVMVCVGFYAYYHTRSYGDYILGGRSLGGFVTALSVGASDMSGWLLMGLPGAVYLAGISQSWIGIGLVLGSYINWCVVASRLRVYTEKTHNALTLPDYFSHRFEDKQNLLRIIAAVVILLFFTIYCASGVVAGARLFENTFSMSYETALILGAAATICYVFVGGFLAVSWTDTIQALLMCLALIVTPIAVMYDLGGFTAATECVASVDIKMLNILEGHTLVGIVSLLAWGLGYFGQPHILVRFMAIRTSKEVKQATHIAMTWVILSLAAAVAVGMVGRVYLTTPLEGTASETVFLVMTNELFPPIATGLILSAVLAAIMSTASSQLLVAASAFAQDFYRTLLRKDAEQKELVWISRASVLVIASLAIFLGLNPNNFILDMVSYAWAGFGAAFGPALLMSLFWRHTTKYGVLVGIIVGGVTVLVWKQYALFGLYEIVPGFLFSTIAIWAVSWLDRVPEASILETFDKVGKSKI